MSSKYIKYMIILLVIMIIIVILLITLLNVIIKDDSYELMLESKYEVLEKREETYLVINESQYFSVRDNIMQKYVKNVETKNAEAVYNMLSVEYKEKNNITIDNIISKLPSYEIPKFIPQKMYIKEQKRINIGKGRAKNERKYNM